MHDCQVSAIFKRTLLRWRTFLIRQVGAIFRRTFLSRCAYSQRRLTQLWSPAPFDIGVRCAYTLKTTALGLVYGPIWPMAYMLTAIGFAFSWIMTRMGMRHWFAKPADVNQDMLMVFRRRLGNVMGLSVVLQVSKSVGR